jgi:16S rRNA (guanine527-N7)-methyltransferase
MSSKLRPLGAAWALDELAAAAGITLTDSSRRGLTVWLDTLVEWNQRMDLTAARSEDELLDLMVFDAMVLAREVPPHARLVDVGTGAGAPGLGVAILRPDLAVTLVEPLTKRVSFMRFVLGSLGRTDVTLRRDRCEALPGNTWDVAVARATLAPAAWLDAGARLVNPGGSVWVLLAREAPPSHDRYRLQQDIEYIWPRTHAARRAARFAVETQ